MEGFLDVFGIELIVAYLHMLTKGHSFREDFKLMITGYDEVELTAEELAYLELNEPDKLKKN